MPERDDLESVNESFGKLSQPFQRATKTLLHPLNPIEHEDAPFTDAAHAERFAAHYALELRYDHRRGIWLWYEPPLWRSDCNERVRNAAVMFARLCQRDALELRNREQKERAVSYYLKHEKKGYIDNTLSLARVFAPLNDTGEGWNTDLWKLGAPNGVIDLKSGLLEQGDPADKISCSVRVPYDETIPEPKRWLQFLNEIFDGETTLVEFVQRYCGYALTGETTEQVLALFYGHGANGKSTLLNTLLWIFGGYGHNMPFSAVELKNRASIPSDVAALDGKRFVTASETTDGTRLNESRIKALTGSDPMTARFMHADFFTFQPVSKFILSVNHKPAVADDSHGFWRRIRLVPFVRTFSGSVKDENLEKKLRGEGQGILRWLVEGCLAWQRDGLTLPKLISDATDHYKDESDPITDFVSECLEIDNESRTPAGQVQEEYQKWADKNHLNKFERLNRKDLARRISERFPRRHTMTCEVYEGVKILTQRLW